jgi:hypothetical protein
MAYLAPFVFANYAIYQKKIAILICERSTRYNGSNTRLEDAAEHTAITIIEMPSW